MAEAATSILSVRLTSAERLLLEDAAGQAHTSLSDYVRRNAVIAAEIEVMERRTFVIPAEKWAEFEARANEPPKDIPALRKLFAAKPVWEK